MTAQSICPDLIPESEEIAAMFEQALKLFARCHHISIQVAMASFAFSKHQVAKAAHSQLCKILQISTYLDLIRPMQITMDTFAQQLHNAKRTAHAKLTYLREVRM